MSASTEIQPDGMLVLDHRVQIPDVLDVLIVGGGPAGTAAAFRAKEMGLVALVIDYDDLMKRIRDYAKDKPILPSFGGGDQMQFPKGGDLVSKLAFEPIQKDEICLRWKGLYCQFGVPAKLGIELMGLDQNLEGIWNATVWNHNSQEEENLFARNVVLAIGRGVPRRLDIPGNVEGISRRLSDPAVYVQGPICIIGGGTSAAEAVIAISNAKKKARDPSDVYWSYRGDKMPKVSKALSGPFFEAYMGNGNIRYLPHSEPVGVITDSEQQDFLCIRSDRKILAGRPIETTQLEFPKCSCIACIGEDVPELLLNSIGIYRASGGPHNRKRFVVNPLMETALPNLYLVGDLLSPAYLQTEDFEADPSGFSEVKRRGNIKSALRDGVFVMEVVAQKLAGATNIHVRLEEVPSHPPQGAPAEPAPARPANSTERLVRLLDGETTAEEFPLRRDAVTTLGTRGCDICFGEDSGLSLCHASIRHQEEGYFISDESGAGLFIQPVEGRRVEVDIGAILKVGEKWLAFGGEAERPQLVHYDAGGAEAACFPLSPGTVVVGREAPHVTLDPSDTALSRRHLSITLRDDQLSFIDLHSTNGTLLKVNGPTPIRHGDLILVGQQTLRFVGTEETTPQDEVRFNVEKVAPPAEAPVEDAASTDSPTVTFSKAGKCLPFRRGQTICELAEEQGVPITAQCHQGICGSDPIRVLSGQENLNPRAENEQDTLEELCSLEGGEYRLACLARPSGSVEVEIVDHD